jgi:hypothetical protein
MRKVLFITIFLGLAMTMAAQTKSQRRIYLWDVTLSMKGYEGRTPDIYDEVVKFLEQEINSITDESTEIVVLPFQESILERWREKADVTGKKTIIQKIKNYKNDQVTNTNIVRPIKDVQSEIISPDKNNILVLLTDGTQSKQFGGKEELIKLIQYWGQYSEKNYAHCLYVMLTPDAIPDNDVKEAIEQTKNIDFVTEPGKMEMIDLQPIELVKVNLKDDKVAEITLAYKKSVVLPDNIKVSVIAEDSVLNVNQTMVVADGKITFDLKYKRPYETLKVELSEVTRWPLHLELLNEEEVEKIAGKIVYLTRSDIGLELINKPEKTLKIRIKK